MNVVVAGLPTKEKGRGKRIPDVDSILTVSQVDLRKLMPRSKLSDEKGFLTEEHCQERWQKGVITKDKIGSSAISIKS